jgi:hypothetical protein
MDGRLTGSGLGSIDPQSHSQVNPMASHSTACTRSRRRTGGLHRRPKLLPLRTSSSEESSRRPMPGPTLLMSPSAAGLQVSARRPRPLDGGLGAGRPRTTRWRRAPYRGEGGGVAVVGDCRHGGGRLLIPEPKAKEDAPVSANTRASASPSRTAPACEARPWGAPPMVTSGAARRFQPQ